MNVMKHSSTSYALSFLAFLSTLMLWGAGSPRIGVFSRVWEIVGGLEILLGISLALYILSAAFIYVGPFHNSSERSMPVSVLIGCFTPFGMFIGNLFFRFMASGN